MLFHKKIIIEKAENKDKFLEKLYSEQILFKIGEGAKYPAANVSVQPGTSDLPMQAEYILVQKTDYRRVYQIAMETGVI